MCVSVPYFFQQEWRTWAWSSSSPRGCWRSVPRTGWGWGGSDGYHGNSLLQRRLLNSSSLPCVLSIAWLLGAHLHFKWFMRGQSSPWAHGPRWQPVTVATRSLCNTKPPGHSDRDCFTVDECRLRLHCTVRVSVFTLRSDDRGREPDARPHGRKPSLFSFFLN